MSWHHIFRINQKPPEPSDSPPEPSDSPPEPPTEVRVEAGTFIRSANRHICKVPSAALRDLGCKMSDIWRCDCGQRWRVVHESGAAIQADCVLDDDSDAPLCKADS